jgi:hypothetical protein
MGINSNNLFGEKGATFISSNLDSTIKFKRFISKFKLLSLPFKANTGCYEPDSALCVPLDMDNDSIYIGYTGPGLAVGIIPDTSNFYAVIYCTASACYMPVLAVYSKNGSLINKREISKGCGIGVGYSCSEILEITSLKEIVVVYTKENFKIDNFGNKIKKSSKKTSDTYKYSVDESGFISVLVAHTFHVGTDLQSKPK